MSLAAEIRVAAPTAEVLALSGSLTFATAARALQQARAAMSVDVQWLDLAGLTEADSAGLAVVIALNRASVRQGRRLQIRGAPESLRALAHLCDVEDLLQLA